jgi:F-type H+-transporting ATPase subunit delta
MAELATIARPYAEALFKASGAELAVAAEWLDELASIAANAQLQQFADSPKVTAQQTFDVITGVAKTALPEKARNFLRTVIDNGRLSALPEIASQFRALKNAKTGSSDAVVYSAFKLNVRVEIEPALIGGVRVVVGDEVLDTSVKARLEQMKVALIA